MTKHHPFMYWQDKLMPQLAGLSISGSSPGGAATGPAYKYRDEAEHQLAWERGNVDYTGVDR